jgi:hypothetical protein
MLAVGWVLCVLGLLCGTRTRWPFGQAEILGRAR